MDHDNVLDAMSTYDFKEPLKTVITIEENDNSDDEYEKTDTGNQNNEKLNEEISKTLEEYVNATDLKKTNGYNHKCPNTHAYNSEQGHSNTISTHEITLRVNEGSFIKGPSPKRKRSNINQNSESCIKNGLDAETDVNKQNDYNNKSEYYIRSTLKIVSENLLHIVAAKTNLMKNLYDKNSIMYGKEDLVYNQIQALKFSFFKMTYCVTVTILLPLQKNTMFIETLMRSTLRFAKINSISCSYEELAKLFSEMIIWTKEYRYKYIPPLSVEHEEYKAYTKPKSPPTYTESIASQQMINGYQQAFQSSMRQHNLSTPGKKQKTLQPPNKFKTINQENCYSNSTNLTPNKNSSRVSNAQSIPISNLPQASNNRTEENIYSPYFQSSNEKNQSLIKIDFQAKTIFSKSIPTDPSNVVIAQSGLTHNMASPYSNTHLNNSVNLDNNPEPNDTSNHYIQQNKTRSVSRDSGFISPLLNNIESTNEMQVTPFITEVTSLNPNVKHVEVGSCVVCQKSTRNVCLGCYKEHYCSYECLMTNWPIHRLRCSNAE